MKEEKTMPVLELEEDITHALTKMTHLDCQIKYLIASARAYHCKLEIERYAEERAIMYNLKTK